MTFTGFSTDDPIKLPRELFSEVLPAIAQLAELKVTLHFFYLLPNSRRRPRMIEWAELCDDAVLARSLRAISPLRPLAEVLEEGLEAAVRRGTLLHVPVPQGPRVGNWYLANTERNRQWAAKVQTGEVSWMPAAAAAPPPPSIFKLYEDNIGLLTPMLSVELKDAQEQYPASWLEGAIREAVRSNKRSWRYIRAVLESWAREGREGFAPSDDDSKYISGELSQYIKF
jgi:DnaD/phage-associated family protein